MMTVIIQSVDKDGFMNRKVSLRWVSLFIMSVFLCLGMLIPTRIAVTLTPSLDKRIFFITFRSGEDARRGDYVLIRKENLNPSGEILPEIRSTLERAGESSIIKRIACISGDTLNGGDMLYFCNGIFIGKAKEKTENGAPAPPFEFEGTIPEGYAFITGDHRDSYDSRYFGFVRLADIAAVVRPLF